MLKKQLEEGSTTIFSYSPSAILTFTFPFCDIALDVVAVTFVIER
ncbi:hypothetical protein [Vibrio galatheae]|nr:hypothetical protein [Vibrio galatheae]